MYSIFSDNGIVLAVWDHKSDSVVYHAPTLSQDDLEFLLDHPIWAELSETDTYPFISAE